jgi:hypothetical protein
MAVKKVKAASPSIKKKKAWRSPPKKLKAAPLLKKKVPVVKKKALVVKKPVVKKKVAPSIKRVKSLPIPQAEREIEVKKTREIIKPSRIQTAEGWKRTQLRLHKMKGVRS